MLSAGSRCIASTARLTLNRARPPLRRSRSAHAKTEDTYCDARTASAVLLSSFSQKRARVHNASQCLEILAWYCSLIRSWNVALRRRLSHHFSARSFACLSVWRRASLGDSRVVYIGIESAERRGKTQADMALNAFSDVMTVP